MKYYSREVTHREKINRFGKIGTPLYVEYFKANSDKTVEEFNKGKRIKFTETTDKEIIKELRKGEINKIYEKKVQK